ncbi:hypothetical protein [Paenibacillus ginsengarvi]|uniref:hypothetical protein n=1 Tax=Paenibacillus ginsengarvi TaxID=400777 RepID=UPI0011C3A3DF|nr:hypothetical protein [Paenibacillus ginsengarvi]
MVAGYGYDQGVKQDDIRRIVRGDGVHGECGSPLFLRLLPGACGEAIAELEVPLSAGERKRNFR